jgi:aerobic carbon-monoxide dehydrogenase small subunit
VKTRVSINVNGALQTHEVEPRLLLVHFLRDYCELTGTHAGCETSICGACTVQIGGKAVKSCTLFAVQADGESVVTVEGLARDGQLHPIQQAFWESHALQCGFCTPGMLLLAWELLRDNASPSEAEIREAISANLCRCTGYQGIVEAVQLAAGRHAVPAGAAR